MRNNIYLSPYRNYRTLYTKDNLEQKIQIIIEETDLLITLTSQIKADLITTLIKNKVQEIRNVIKFWIQLVPEIQHSLEPIAIPKNAPNYIEIMCESAKYAYVGPFAAIAGTIAQIVCCFIHEYLKNNQLPDDVIVENGGDIYLYSKKERIIGIMPNPQENCMLGLKINPSDMPLSICSSSAKIGHSLSFGKGDLALIIAKNASLADALATSYCNQLQKKEDISLLLEKAKKDNLIKILDNPYNNSTESSGLMGIFLQIDENIGAWGNIELTIIH